MRRRKKSAPAVVQPSLPRDGLMPVTLTGEYGKEQGLPSADTRLTVSTSKGMAGPFYLRDGRRAIHYYGGETEPHLLLVLWKQRGDPWAAAVAVPIGRVFYD